MITDCIPLCFQYGYICVFNNISDFSTAGFYNYRQFSTFSTGKYGLQRAFRKKFCSFSAKHRYFIVFHSFHEFSTGKTPGNGGKPVFLWKRGTCRGVGPWLRLYLVYKRFIFAPCIAGCERWKNKSFQHHCGKRCGKSLEGEREAAGGPSEPFRPARKRAATSPKRGGFLCSLRSQKAINKASNKKAAARTGTAAFFNTVV